jgi:hypothetical protein
MRRRLTIAALAAAALAAGAPLASAESSSVTVRLVSCSLAEHEAVFYARMSTIPGAARMGVRFTLLERTGSEGFAPVKAPGLRRWRRSSSGVTEFGYRQTLRNLPANAAYRVRVDYRWYAADGTIVLEARRRSPVCRQFAALPNLVTELVGASGTQVPGVLRYEVRLSNPGKASVAGAAVRLSLDGHVLDTVTVALLLPGEGKLVAFSGPACVNFARALADPEEVIFESSESDNLDVVSCADLAPA